MGKKYEIMEVAKTEGKGNHLNTLEKYYIYRPCKQGIQLNNNYTDTHNPVFKEIYNISQYSPQCYPRLYTPSSPILMLPQVKHATYTTPPPPSPPSPHSTL
jgi:hypothetical protein